MITNFEIFRNFSADETSQSVQTFYQTTKNFEELQKVWRSLDFLHIEFCACSSAEKVCDGEKFVRAKNFLTWEKFRKWIIYFVIVDDKVSAVKLFVGEDSSQKFKFNRRLNFAFQKVFSWQTSQDFPHFSIFHFGSSDKILSVNKDSGSKIYRKKLQIICDKLKLSN